MMDEKFFAWLDGELDPAEAAEMQKRVAADPELAQDRETVFACVGHDVRITWPWGAG